MLQQPPRGCHEASDAGQIVASCVGAMRSWSRGAQGLSPGEGDNTGPCSSEDDHTLGGVMHRVPRPPSPFLRCDAPRRGDRTHHWAHLARIPGVVIRTLIGADGGATSTIVGRVLGGALVALGIAGASSRIRTPERPIVLAYVVYNVSTAPILAAASVAGTASGILPWPVVAVHALLALVLLGGLLLKAPSRTASR
jgi:hypothetical protein